MEKELPLGKKTNYPDRYDPLQLSPIPRSASRAANGIDNPLPFTGMDVWNAWELTWLGPGNRPVVTTATIQVPADSPNLIESKSLKLYLNSFAMSQYRSPSVVQTTLANDLTECAGASVNVELDIDASIAELEGNCIDTASIECERWQPDATLLVCDVDHAVSEILHTHSLRSLCPVTGQPDLGSLQISYGGPRIDPGSLLQYIVSFRNHNDFHEACVERMFVDLMERCSPEKLSVYARYQRRGGIDINPFRSSFETTPGNPRLWRQ